jgi:hydrogenase-4 transcriptional activator
VLKLAKDKIDGPGGAAEMLGINPSTLRSRLDKLGISYRRRGRESN